MKKLILILFILPIIGNSQFVLTDGKKSMEISGVVYTYYNYRFLQEGETDKDKNLFRLRDARVKFVGDLKKKITFNLDINFAGLQTQNVDESATYNPFLNDANITWTAPGKLDLCVGYQGIEFSRSSMASIFTSPFMERPQFTKGDYFNRRDLGISLNKLFWKKRVRINAGVFNGLGTALPDNDQSGKLLYSGRIDFSYPAKVDFDEADMEKLDKLNFAAGADIMYSNKQRATDPEYPIFVDGKRMVYGADFQLMWKGFSLIGEINQLRGTPNDSNDVWLYNQNTRYFRSGAWTLSASYYNKQWNSLFGVRYDDVNFNDIVRGDNRRTISIAYTYMLNDFKTCFRIQYWHRLNQELTGERWNNNQLRVGVQVMIR